MSEESKKTESESRVESQTEQTTVININESRYQDVITRKFREREIKIYGTTEQPLFNAEEIGEVIGIQKIKKAIRNYGSKEKVLITWSQESQKQEFLTELGIQRLIMRQNSQKNSLVQELQEWVIEVIKEIRLEGQTQLREMYEENEYIYKQTEEIYRQENRVLREQNEIYKKKIQQRERAYQKIEYKNTVKIYRQGQQDEREIYQVGEQEKELTKSILQKHRKEKSECSAQSQEVELLNEIYKKDCIDGRLCECVIKGILEKQGYEIQRINRKTYYKCKLEHIVRIVECVCDVINVLMQCKEDIKEEELVERLRGEVEGKIETEESMEKKKDIKEEINSWLKKNVKYREDQIIFCEDIRKCINKEEERRKVGKEELIKYMREYFEENYNSVCIKTLKIRGYGQEKAIINVQLMEDEE